jgi:hypothetical protein
MSPPKKISCLRSNKSDNETISFTHLIHFLYQNLKQFYPVSICSVSKIQHSNGTVSSYRLTSKIISASFTQQNDTISWCGGSSCDEKTAISQSVSSHYVVSVMTTKRLYRGPEGHHSCSVTYMSLHLATLACGSFNWPVTRRKLRQPITFEEF